MTTIPLSVPGSEFNDFLFAPLGEDKNGMLVSVLSGFARSDVDPWQEAAKLAQLPGETATKELAALIGALPDGAVSYADPRKTATRLIALLPRPHGLSGGTRQTQHGAQSKFNRHPWWVYAGIISFVLGSHFIATSHLRPTKPHTVEVNAPSTVVTPAAPLNYGQ